MTKLVINIWHIIGIISSLLVLPFFFSMLTESMLGFNLKYLLYFFTAPALTGDIVHSIRSYVMYIIAFLYVIYMVRKIYGWYKKANA